MLKKSAFLIAILICTTLASAIADVKILSISGDVKIRRGIEESWQQAHADVLLKETDTILTGKKSSAELHLDNGEVLKLKSDTMLDIFEMRKVSEQQLFIYLMSLKVKGIEPLQEKTKIRVGIVSVIHGESKTDAGQSDRINGPSDFSMQEKNGANALYSNELYPNAIIKMHKILIKYSFLDECGELHYYLAKSFQAMSKKGQALDALRIAAEKHENNGCSASWYSDALNSMDHLKNE